VDDPFISLKKRAAVISLSTGILMFIGKLGAYIITGSAVILSDALESIVHIIATGFAFYSLYLSTKPPDPGHPYGHGKIEYFSAGFEGALIIIAAISIIIYAVRDFFFYRELEQIDTGAEIVLTAGVINAALGFYLIRTGKKTNSLVLIADGKHVLSDSYTSIVAFIALLFVFWTGLRWIDSLAALLVGINIIITGKNLVRLSVGGLMNETDEKTLEQIAKALDEIRRKESRIIDLHLLRYWQSGSRYFVDFHLTIPYYNSVEEAHELTHKIEELFKEIFHTNEIEMLSHIEPCEPTCCPVCMKQDCKVRKSVFTKEITWDKNKIISLSEYSRI
jgi:cation diffusion facilitator family transporter